MVGDIEITGCDIEITGCNIEITGCNFEITVVILRSLLWYCQYQ